MSEERWAAAEQAGEPARPEPARDSEAPAGSGAAHWSWRSLELPPRPESVPTARRWAMGVLAEWGADDVEWVVAQLLTEVATNVVLHGGTTFEVRLGHEVGGQGLVRCEVIDGNPVLPRRRRHSVSATTGRGLEMLENASTRWGAQPQGGGKFVWFEVEPGGDEGVQGVDLDLMLDLYGADRSVPGTESATPSASPRREAPARAEGSRPGPTAKACRRVPAPRAPAGIRSLVPAGRQGAAA